MRQLVGDDGQTIARFWASIMSDSNAKTTDRIEASRLLADRGWGKAPTHEPPLVDDDDTHEIRLEAAAKRFNEEVRRLAALQD